MQVSRGQVPSSSASRQSTKRRTQSLGDIRRYVSANDSLSQLSREVMSCTYSDRSKLLQEISAESCVISVSTADALAMRMELNIPWHKFRALKRSLPFVVLDVFIIYYNVLS